MFKSQAAHVDLSKEKHELRVENECNVLHAIMNTLNRMILKDSIGVENHNAGSAHNSTLLSKLDPIDVRSILLLKNS